MLLSDLFESTANWPNSHRREIDALTVRTRAGGKDVPSTRTRQQNPPKLERTYGSRENKGENGKNLTLAVMTTTAAVLGMFFRKAGTFRQRKHEAVGLFLFQR